MIFRRRKFPLPKFPITIRQAFEGWCEELSVERIEMLQRELIAAVEAMRTRDDAQAGRLNIAFVEALRDRSELLLSRYAEFTPAQRKLAIGAIRYFVSPDDPVCDTTFASGLDDDVRVMNHVLEELGLVEFVIRR